MDSDLMFDDLSSYLDYSSTDKPSPELNSFINSPSQTIPTENSSITNLKGLYGESSNLNQDALHSILSTIEQNRKNSESYKHNMAHTYVSSASSVANDDDVLTKPEFINPVLLSSHTLPKLPSSLSPKTAVVEEPAPLISDTSNNNLFIDSHLGSEFGTNDYFNGLFDGFVERDSLILNNEDEEDDDDEEEDPHSIARRGSELLTPGNMLGNRKASITQQQLELLSPSSQHTHLRTKSELEKEEEEHEEEEGEPHETDHLSKSLSQYSLNFHSTTKLTKFRNRRQSVHGMATNTAGVSKRKSSLESPLTSPSRTLQALGNSNNQYRLNTNSGTLNNLFAWENAILSDDEDNKDRRNSFITSPSTTREALNTDDNDLEVVEPSVNVSPVFNPKTFSALDPKYIGGAVNKPYEKNFTAPISLSSRTRMVNATLPSTPGSTVSSSSRRRRRSAITPVASRVSSTSSRRNRSISVELSDGESKPFQCGDCDKAFRRSEHLKRHIRSVHSNERPFPCMFCEKKFSRSDNLSQHLKTHKKHGDF
ncbi:stress-responsive transcriptional activator MSN4 [Nakaseomyces bracarensis]|uniref:stress-responsive transcriptional activator MSN4 n=1 Tax=Nakaseomyces bracarensis TaxID=273131 RepID=UPI0038714721